MGVIPGISSPSAWPEREDLAADLDFFFPASESESESESEEEERDELELEVVVLELSESEESSRFLERVFLSEMVTSASLSLSSESLPAVRDLDRR
jgi:ribosomal protein S1